MVLRMAKGQLLQQFLMAMYSTAQGGFPKNPHPRGLIRQPTAFPLTCTQSFPYNNPAVPRGLIIQLLSPRREIR